MADARIASQIFDGRFADNDALQTYFLSVLAGGGVSYSGDGSYGFFSEAVASNGGTLINDRISSNGTYTVFLAPGKYTFGALGDFGGGSLLVSFGDGDDLAPFVEASNPLTAGGGFVFHNPTDRVHFVLSGATAPDLKIYLNTTP